MSARIFGLVGHFRHAPRVGKNGKQRPSSQVDVTTTKGESMSAMAVNDISRWKKSAHKCPACERVLWTLMLPEGRIWFCGWGPCPSLTTNDGASSIEELNRKWEAEPEQAEKEEWP